MPLNAGELFGGYRIDAVVGRGGMGVVYRAQQQRPRRNVALKVIGAELSSDAQFRERFEREAELAASIEHPNIVPVYEVGEHAGQLFIAMRFVDGPNLATLLRDGPVTPRRAVFYVERLASALGAAHQAGLIHRDVKPANVLIRQSAGDEQHVYLTDFGLARLVDSSAGLTGSGQFLGTPGYAAPEQIRGLPLDARADVYALGCVLYELVTGQRVFPRRQSDAVMFAHVNEPPAPPSRINPELPAGIDDVLAMALAKDPDERFTSTSALARAAAGALTVEREPDTAACPTCLSPVPARSALCPHCGAPSQTTSTTQATVPLAPITRRKAPETVPVASAPRRRSAWLIPVAAALAAAVAVFAVLALNGRGPSTPPPADGATPTVEALQTAAPTSTATSTPASTATPADTPTATPSAAPIAIAPVPEAPTPRTIAFQTGTDPDKSLPAAYCRVTGGQLTCWTPNDGYTLRMDVTGAPRRARDEESGNKRRMPEGYDRLGFGSTRGRDGFKCTSRRSGLSCVNAAGHGFTLPRYVGLPSLY